VSQTDTIALVSGGLDSAVALYWARSEGYNIVKTINFQYGQTHAMEQAACQVICSMARVPEPTIIKIDLEFLRGATALMPLGGQFSQEEAAKTELVAGENVSATFVPGRNIIMLAMVGGLADSVRAGHVIGGWNAVDYSGYPDCRPKFLYSMEDTLRLGLRWPIRILAPLVFLDKASIIKLGAKLGVPFEVTWSCYAGGERPCGQCPSCKVRIKGFADANLEDPGLYTYD
jgi:7-cyano-7-deazaguanine synthase